MAKPATPAVWASGKVFSFRPSAAQQAQGFDYIASVRPGTGAPITDDHDFPLLQVTAALAWVMGTGSDGMLPKRSFTSNDYIRIPDEPGGFIIQWGPIPAINQGGDVVVTYPTPYPNACLATIPVAGSAGCVNSILLGGGGNQRASFKAFNNLAGAPATGAGLYISIGC
ncbi:MAG: gp53-like domain-containing protein [Shewanella sp.]